MNINYYFSIHYIYTFNNFTGSVHSVKLTFGDKNVSDEDSDEDNNK